MRQNRMRFKMYCIHYVFRFQNSYNGACLGVGGCVDLMDKLHNDEVRPKYVVKSFRL